MIKNSNIETVVIEDYQINETHIILCLEDKREVKILRQNITLDDIHLLEYRYNSISFKGVIKKSKYSHYSVSFEIIIHRDINKPFPE